MYKLLLVEDNEIQLESIRMFIEWGKYPLSEIKIANDGIQALKIWKEWSPDIIITDIFMPRLNGLDMLKKIRAEDNQVKIIIISAYENVDYAKQAISFHVDAYLLKPIRYEDFDTSMKETIKAVAEKKDFLRVKKMNAQGIEFVRENYLYSVKHKTQKQSEKRGEWHAEAFKDCHCFFAVVISFPDADELKFEHMYDLMLLLRKQFDCTAIIDSDNYLFMLVYAKDEETLKETRGEMQSFIEEQNMHNIEVGISENGDEITQIKDLYEQAKMALENRYFSIADNIYRFESLEREYSVAGYEDIKSELSKHLLDYSMKTTQEYVDKFLPSNLTDSKELKKACFMITLCLQDLMIERGYKIKDLFGVMLWEKLEAFETIPDPRMLIKNSIDAVMEHLTRNENNKYQKIIREIKEYIDEHYATIVNISSITEHMYISVSYAKHIFKKYTNQTIFEYLTLKRVEEAKSLLQDPYIKVYEVCEMVGYKSKDHFTEIFKRYTGVVPTEYQKKVRE